LSRSHGIGVLWDQAEEDDQVIRLGIATDRVRYELEFGLATGRIDENPGERLVNSQGDTLISRQIGADVAELYHTAVNQLVTVNLREPEKLSLNLYLNFNPQDQQAGDLDRLLHYIRYYHARSFFLHRLKSRGSDSGPETRLWERGDNAWSVLRNLHDRRRVDDRYETIMSFMAKAFPTFEGVLVEQTGPNSVYASFHERDKTHPINASGVSDGHLHLLLVLLALFSEGPERDALLLFDEPEISLHPWAISVFAEAVKLAVSGWNKQVLIATHSPVLISQFEPDAILATEIDGAMTRIRRVSEIDEIEDLLEEYAAGSLYMSQMIGRQSDLPVVEE
jgi:predicted ATPase